MTVPGAWSRIRMLLLLVLWTAAGASGSEATRSHAEVNVSLDPAAIFNRMMRANTEKAAEAARPPAGDVTRKLWRSRVSAPEQANDAQDQIGLDELVRRIRSMKFQAREQEPLAAAAFVMPEPLTSHPEAAPSQGRPAEQAAQPVLTASATPEGPLPAEAEEALKRVLADPNQASHPRELAELLYLTGKLAEAAILYQKALDLAAGSGPAARADRAWMLLQLGNCLRDTDPGRAKGAYGKLIAEHADCPWVELAKAHSQLITWYEQVQPRQWVSGQEGPLSRHVAASQKPQR